ncbi:MAG: DNA alkylation repair protein, partial [Gammaproteobacteria bacterium]|nr:DNA alkylation repair protein [Gammaproteobacteria bacterium]
KADLAGREQIYKTFKRHIKLVNNWDLIDNSAPYIVGPYLINKPKAQLDKWARSKNLWLRRIAIMSTFYFIKQDRFNDTLRIARSLLKDEQDLIHKAVGWMLREIGNRDMVAEEKFLRKHYKNMPRTMLRYAIEKFPKSKRAAYLSGDI